MNEQINKKPAYCLYNEISVPLTSLLCKPSVELSGRSQRKRRSLRQVEKQNLKIRAEKYKLSYYTIS